MGGPRVHPTGATLALGDPPRSLNAPGGCLGYLLWLGVPGPAPEVGLGQSPVLVAATDAAIWYGQGSDKQSDPLRHKGSIEEAFYPAAALGHDDKVPLRHNQSTEGDQGYTWVVVP